MSKYLGIDYGLAHIGLASSEHSLATPLPALVNDDHLLDRLSEIVRGESITHIVCGIPEGRLAPIIEDFATQLSLKTGIQVILHEETLSTHDATEKLVQAGASRSKRRNEHSYAACLILEDFLDLHS